MKKSVFTLFIPVIAVCLIAMAFAVPSAIQSSHKISKGDKDIALTEQGKKLIEKSLMKPLKAKLGTDSKLGMFSRCPSGMGFSVAEFAQGDTYFNGYVYNNAGCTRVEVCVFRLSLDEKTIEVKRMAEDPEFISPQAFLSNEENFSASIR